MQTVALGNEIFGFLTEFCALFFEFAGLAIVKGSDDVKTRPVLEFFKAHPSIL